MAVTELVRADRHQGHGCDWADWRSRLENVIKGVDISAGQSPDVDGELLAYDFAGARMWYFHSQPQILIRRRPASRPPFKPMAILQMAGCSRLTQFGRSCEIAVGEFAFLDASSPLMIESPGEFRTLCLQFPATAFAPSEFRHAATSKASKTWGPDRLFYDCACEIWLSALQFAPLEHSAALNALISLCGLTTAFRRREIPDALPIRVTRAMAHIEHNLGETWLSPQAVADAQNVSRRYLDDLFVKSGHRIESWIWERRLVRAKEELRVHSAAHLCKKSILQVALDLGFKSPSHFSRTFSNRFGISPRDYRRQFEITADTAQLET